MKPYPRDESLKDAAIVMGKAAADLVPVLPNLIDRLVVPPLKKRQIAWFDEVAQTLNSVETELCTMKEKAQEEFLTFFVHASQAALRTHELEKRHMFLNALRNAALLPGDFERRLFFVQLLDNFQLLHIKVLQVFSDPKAILEKHYVQQRKATIAELVTLEGKQLAAFMPIVLGDLESKGLIDPAVKEWVECLRLEVTGSATELGKSFLRFIQTTD